MSNENSVVAFKTAGLPSADVGQFRKALANASQTIQVAGGNAFLRMDKRDGAWVYGAKDTEVEEGSLWAVNPLSLKVGFVCWNPKGGAPLGKQMVSIFQTPINIADLPNFGAKWDDNISLEMMCTNGEDKGITVEYTANSYGGKKAFSDLVAALQRQLDTDPKHIVPVIALTYDSYQHATYGLTYNPIFDIKSWIAMDAPSPAAAETTKTAEQPAATAPPAQPPVAETAEAPRRGRGRGPVTDVAPEQPAPATQAAQQPAAAAAADPTVRRRRRAAA